MANTSTFGTLPVGTAFTFAGSTTGLTYTKASKWKYRHPEIKTWLYKVGAYHAPVVVVADPVVVSASDRLSRLR